MLKELKIKEIINENSEVIGFCSTLALINKVKSV